MSSIFGKSIFKILSHFRPFRKHNILTSRSLSLFGKRDNAKNISPYIIVRASKDESDEILKVMHESYYEEEPTCAALNITPNAILDELALKALAEGFTLVAKCKYNGCIVGACINESTNPWDPDMDEKLACTVSDENVRKLIFFYAYMSRAPDLWRRLGVQRVFELSYLFVKRPHRKKGIAYRLLHDSKTMGADAGFPVVRCDATSHHTAKICEHLNMQKVAEIPYCSYLNQQLEPILRPPWPHAEVKIYCDCAPQFNELHSKLKQKSKIFKSRK